MREREYRTDERMLSNSTADRLEYLADTMGGERDIVPGMPRQGTLRSAASELRSLAKRLSDVQESKWVIELLMTVAQNARMVRAVAESYAELDPKWAKSTLDYFHGVVTEPLERAAELSTKEATQ